MKTARKLLSKTHWTKCGAMDGSAEFVIWRMWLGRCYDVTRIPAGRWEN
jgi:hypothetical protein